ncbi:malonic semialdehyde reductase [Glaciihabitans sp. UYNi722]|uniref:malonic semialdehyde reductase n=1 Tax=Glaciihabitans sp. UYNi722 TaxID=3156344 RepID=UPI0033916A5C
MTSVLENHPAVAPQRLSEESLHTLFSRAATANSFAPTPVTDDELRSIWDLAKWPPTAANFQPMRVLFVQSTEGRAKLGEFMNDNNREKTLAAPAVAVLAFDRTWHENIATTTPHLAHMTDYFAENEDPRLDAARNNSWLQAGYFILAIRALGLAAGPMLGFTADAIDAEFFDDGRWGTFLVINIGHPTEGSYRARLPRLDAEHTVHFA